MRDIYVIYGNQIIPPTNTHLEQDTFQYYPPDFRQYCTLHDYETGIA